MFWLQLLFRYSRRLWLTFPWSFRFTHQKTLNGHRKNPCLLDLWLYLDIQNNCLQIWFMWMLTIGPMAFLSHLFQIRATKKVFCAYFLSHHSDFCGRVLLLNRLALRIKLLGKELKPFSLLPKKQYHFWIYIQRKGQFSYPPHLFLYNRNKLFSNKILCIPKRNIKGDF